MARVLLIQPPLLLASDFIDYPYFTNLGVWQAAAALRQAGHDPQVLDAFCQPNSGLLLESSPLVRLGVPLSGLLAKLPALAPDVVVIGYSPWLRATAATAELAKLCKSLRERWPAPIVLADCDVGGMHTIAWDATALDEVAADYGLRFEADVALPALVSTLASGEKPSQRLLFGAPIGDDLDGLPLPAYDLVDRMAYQRFLDRCGQANHKQEIFALGAGLLPVKTSRGCSFACNFCTSNPWSREGLPGKPYRRMGKDLLAEHARRCRQELGIHRWVVLDELVNVHSGHFDALLDVAEQYELELDFPNGMRADRLSEAQVARMVGRVPVLSISAESAVDRVANDLIGKRFDLQATERVAEWCQRHGLPLVVHWMIGQPSETRAEILQTLVTAWDLFERLGARPLLQFATPILGTRLHATVTEQGRWVTREDRDIGPLFQGKPLLRGPDWTPHDLAMAKKVFETKLEAWAPRKVIVNTTYICNNHCVFCATGNRSDWHGQADEQVAFLAERRKQGFDLCDFDGGEPTTNPELFRLIRAARQLGYRAVNLTTNGRLLSNPKNAEKIVRSGLTSLLVSLHGPNPDVHDRNVQVRGAFVQTTAGIRNARPLCEKLGIDFGVNVTLTTINTPFLMEYGDLLMDMGVKSCNIQFLTPFGRASAECQPDPAEAAHQAMALIDRYGKDIRFQVINLPMCFMPGYEEYGLSDIGKLQRHMLFVSMDDVNLFDYLQSRRRHEDKCKNCLYSIACEGFYYWPDQWHDEARQKFGD
ncbi:MAG: radical SAM protein [Deltaproteobacteria bacterium]|nr:radical SAM protein [Deltaproteobacteria bacterium]